MIEMWSNDEEARRLHERFDALKKATSIGQAKFARDYDIPGGPSMVSQHIKGRRPLNLEAATAYARGFQCPLSDISPRLAKEVKEATREMRSSIPSQSASTDLDAALQTLSGYLSTVSESRRRSVVGLFTDLIHSPGDEQILEVLKTLLESQAFAKEKKKSA